MSSKLPYKSATQSKSIRFPIDLIDRAEKYLAGTGQTFSALVVHVLRSTLDEWDKEEKQ